MHVCVGQPISLAKKGASMGVKMGNKERGEFSSVLRARLIRAAHGSLWQHSEAECCHVAPLGGSA